MEKWHLYTYGRSVTVHTDHKTLTTLLTAGTSGTKPLRILRWTERLRAYPQMTMKYIPGNQNHMADMLSRFVTDTPAQTAGNTKCTEPDVQAILMTHLLPIITQEEVKRLSLADPILQQVHHFIVHRWPTKIQVSKEIQPYFRVKDELFIWSDHCVGRGNCVVIPTSLRQRILQLAHTGHHGIVRTKQTCRSSVWWPGIDSDVEHFVRNCDACTLSGKSIHPQQPPQQITDTPPGPWHSLQLDICGDFRAAPHHQRYAIVLIDKYSKWPEICLTGDITTQAVINFLEGVWARWGIPVDLTTDNGVQFRQEFHHYLVSRGITHKLTPLYCPQINGNIERFNRTLKEGITAHLAVGWNFKDSAREVVRTYRATVCDTTGGSPSFLMFGREMRTSLHALRPARADGGTLDAGKVKKNILRSKIKSKQYHDLKCMRKEGDQIDSGDWIRIKTPTSRLPNKLSEKYREPTRVVKRWRTTVLLDNGERWHINKCVKVPPPQLVDVLKGGDKGHADDLRAAPAAAPQPALMQQQLPVRRSNRTRRAPLRYGFD